MLAASAETCGHAIEVPERILNWEGFLCLGTPPVRFPIHAATMLTPGAAISGYKETKFYFLSKINNLNVYPS